MINQQAQQYPKAEKRFFYGYIIVLISLIISMIGMGIYFSIGVFFKPMMNEFGWSRTITSGPVSLSWIVGGLLGITMGWLNDKFGPRLVTSLCGLFFGAGYLLMSQISNTWQLYFFYGILIGAGSSIPIPIMSTICRWFVRRRTIMTGFFVAGSGIGGLFIPPVANWLILTHGWRIAFIVLGSVILVVLVAAAQFLKRDPSQTGQLPYGVDAGTEEKSKINDKGLSLQEAVNTRQIWLMFILFFCLSWSVNTIILHLVPHVTDLGLSATTAAYVLASMNGAGIFGRVLLGSMGDKVGNKKVLMASFIILGMAFFWLIPLKQLWTLYLFAMIFGLISGAGITQQSPMIAAIFGLNSHGQILGVIGIGHTLGAALGTLTAGYIFDVSGSYQTSFIVSGILCFAGLALAAYVVPIKQGIERVASRVRSPSVD